MKEIRILAILLIPTLFSACSKETPPGESYSDDYRFFVKGKASGIPFEYYAGKDNYYMETSYDLEDSVVAMTGRLAPEGSLQKNAVEIKIRSKQSISSLSEFEPDTNLQPGAYAMRDATGMTIRDDKYLLSLYCDSTDYLDHEWKFPNGTTSKDYSVYKEVSLQEHETYTVGLETTGPFGCNTTVEHVINLEEDCDATFDVQNLAGFRSKLTLQNITGDVVEVKWFLNNSLVHNDSIDSLFLGNTGQPHHIRCEVYFANGCQKIIRRKLSNFANNCITDFYYEKERQVVYDPRQQATVEITYYDETGKAYSSYYNDVTGDFKIVSTTPFSENEEGNPTTRFFFEAEVMLKSDDGSTLELKEMFGSFAVAHP